MVEDAVLFSLLILAIVLGLVLMLASAATLGRKLADLEYQRRVGINGVRKIQSIINVRTHAMRVYLGFVFVVVAVLALVPVPELARSWTARVLFVTLLLVYAVSSILDWLDEGRQQDILVDEQVRDEKLRSASGPPPPAPPWSDPNVSVRS